MKVKFKNPVAMYRDLTPGNVYRVIGIEAGDYRIMNDHGQPYLYPRRLFRVVDRKTGLGWRESRGEDGERYAYPPALGEPGFFEDFFDGQRAAIAALHRYLVQSGSENDGAAPAKQSAARTHAA